MSAAPPDFAHDVAPIVYQHCVSCHHPGGMGPFSLASYADLYKRASQIASVTRRRFMPPWLPEEGYGDFAGENRLTDSQIRTIAEWAAAGAPEGPQVQIPTPPQFSEGWQLGPPDLVLEAKDSLTVPASGPDIFWNFPFTPKLTGPRYVRAVEIRPGNPRVVHHSNLMVDRGGSAHRAAAAGSSGFPGMDLTVVRSPFDPDGNFLFWKPGVPPHEEAPGFSWRLLPGDAFVLNTHLHPSGKPEAVHPQVGTYFTRYSAIALSSAGTVGTRRRTPHSRGQARLRSDRRSAAPDGCGRARGLSARALSRHASRSLCHIARRQSPLAHPHSALGFQLAGSLLLSRAAVSAQGNRDFDAIPFRQLGGERP